MMEEPFDTNNPDSLRLSPERPTLITVICVLGFLGAGYYIILFLLGMIAADINYVILLILLLTGIIGFALYMGLWNMKKWAAISIPCLYVLYVALSISVGRVKIGELIISGIFAIAPLFQLSKMK